jgi:hypothetical protein
MEHNLLKVARKAEKKAAKKAAVERRIAGS